MDTLFGLRSNPPHFQTQELVCWLIRLWKPNGSVKERRATKWSGFFYVFQFCFCILVRSVTQTRNVFYKTIVPTSVSRRAFGGIWLRALVNIRRHYKSWKIECVTKAQKGFAARVRRVWGERVQREEGRTEHVSWNKVALEQHPLYGVVEHKLRASR